MRITGCELTAYGHFRDTTLADLDHQIVCVYGPNEAGKSTFFSFLRTMLYGFSPTSSHPYAPADGSPLAGRLRYRISGGEPVVVERKLASAPTATLERGGSVLASRPCRSDVGIARSDRRTRALPLAE